MRTLWMRIAFAAALLFVLSRAELLMAQGSGPNRSISSFEVKKTISGSVLSINMTEGTLMVEDKKGQRYKFYLDEDTEFKADKNSELSNQKDLSLEHFKKGHTVKVTYRADGKRVFEVRFKKIEKGT